MRTISCIDILTFCNHYLKWIDEGERNLTNSNHLPKTSDRKIETKSSLHSPRPVLVVDEPQTVSNKSSRRYGNTHNIIYHMTARYSLQVWVFKTKIAQKCMNFISNTRGWYYFFVFPSYRDVGFNQRHLGNFQKVNV